MKSFNPNDEYDVKELANLSAEPWMVNCLKYNPKYVHWGNHEDYMREKDGGWRSPISVDNVAGLFALDDMNECVHFYFRIYRSSKECTACEGSGYNKETYQLSEDWYDFKGTGRKWYHDLTQDEVDALWNEGRLSGRGFPEKPTAEALNEAYKTGM